MLIGIGTVFVGLFAIQGIISVLKIVAGPKNAKPVATQGAQGLAGASAGGEQLVAAISAAVAAYRGAEAPAFRIASVQALVPTGAQVGSPSSFNTPSWGYIERLTRQAGGR